MGGWGLPLPLAVVVEAHAVVRNVALGAGDIHREERALTQRLRADAQQAARLACRRTCRCMHRVQVQVQEHASGRAGAAR